jgi:hypothetical protein
VTGLLHRDDVPQLMSKKHAYKPLSLNYQARPAKEVVLAVLLPLPMRRDLRCAAKACTQRKMISSAVGTAFAQLNANKLCSKRVWHRCRNGPKGASHAVPCPFSNKAHSSGGMHHVSTDIRTRSRRCRRWKSQQCQA